MITNTTVLVVDGNLELNRSVAGCLSKKYSVITAFDVQQGVQKAIAAEPALIVTGIAPQSGGAALIAQINQHPELAETPILLLSGPADEALKIKLLNEGAQDFLAMPFSEADLLVRAANLIKLKQCREDYQILFKYLDQGFCTIEVIFDEHLKPIDYRFLEVNDAFKNQTGLADAVGKRMRELAPAHEQHWFDIYGKIALTGEPVRFENKAEALGRWYEVYAFRTGNPKSRKVAVFFNDITERKRAEQKTRENAERLHLALLAGHLGDWSWDAATDIVTLSPEAAEIFGLPPGKPITWTQMRELLYPEDREMARVAVEKALANKSYYNVEYRVNHPSGVVWIAAQGRGLYANNSITGMAGIVQDITARKHAEEELSRSQEELRAMANSIPQLAWIAEPDGHIFWYNQRWYEYTGTTLQEMMGWGWEKVHHPEHLGRVIDKWKHALASGQPWEDTFPLRGIDGQYRWFLSRAFPVRDAQGKITRWFGTNTDIENVRETENALKEEARVLEVLISTGTAIASQLDLQMLVQTVTDTSTALSGAQFGAFFYNVIDDQGESLLLYALSGVPRSAFDKFGLPRNTPVFNTTFKGEGVVRSADITKDPRYGQVPPHHGLPKGHPAVRSFLAVPVISRSGEPIGGLFFGHSEVGVFTERSERIIVGIAAQAAIAIDNARLYEARKKAEAALRSAHEELELRVIERTAKLSEAVAQMEEFSYTVSHDLRAPLRGMQAYSKFLLEELPEVLASRPDAIEYLKRIGNNASRLDKMVLDVLTFSRVARAELTLERVSMDKLVRELVEHYPSMRPPNAEIDIEPLPDVLGHEPSLTQIISNLLTNAVKFVAPGTLPKIRIWSEKHDQEVRIWIEDNGIGIDPKYHHRLFRMFERIHPHPDYEGTGVGLAIVRKAAERMNGTVGVESDGKNGSKFWIQLRKA